MSPVRPRSPLQNKILPAVHFSYNSAGQKLDSPPEARYPSGKGEVCKTFMRRFDPDPRLQIFASNKTPGRGFCYLRPWLLLVLECFLGDYFVMIVRYIVLAAAALTVATHV